MPIRQPHLSRAKPAPPTRGNFRKRYDDLEDQRTALVVRLRMIGGTSQRHPGYKRTLKLLNDTFRKSKATQRLAILQAAAWLIGVLEQITMTL